MVNGQTTKASKISTPRPSPLPSPPPHYTIDAHRDIGVYSGSEVSEEDPYQNQNMEP